MDDALIKYQQSCSKCEQTPHNLQELIDGIKPEKVSQNKPTESILSIAIDNLIWRLAFFILGIIVVISIMFIRRYLFNNNQIYMLFVNIQIYFIIEYIHNPDTEQNHE